MADSSATRDALSPVRARNQFLRARRELDEEIESLAAIARENATFTSAGTPIDHQTLVAKAKKAIRALEVYRPEALAAAEQHIQQREAAVSSITESESFRDSVERAKEAVRELLTLLAGDTNDKLLTRTLRKLELPKPDILALREWPHYLHRLANKLDVLGSKTSLTWDPWGESADDSGKPQRHRLPSRQVKSPKPHAAICELREQVQAVIETGGSYVRDANSGPYANTDDVYCLLTVVCGGLEGMVGGPRHDGAWIETIRHGMAWIDDWLEENTPQPKHVDEEDRGASAENRRSVSEASQTVTLRQLAALVNKSKRTLETQVKKGVLPPADIPGGDGKAHHWYYTNVRGPLEKYAGRPLPDMFPVFSPEESKIFGRA